MLRNDSQFPESFTATGMIHFKDVVVIVMLDNMLDKTDFNFARDGLCSLPQSVHRAAISSRAAPPNIWFNIKYWAGAAVI